MSPGTARLPQQGLEAGAGAVGQPFQPQMHQGPVFSLQEHHVRHRADGGQLAVVQQHLGTLGGGGEGQGQLQRYPHTRQIGEGVGAVGAAGVHHRHGLGQDLFALVVVGDDHVHPQGPGVLHLLGGGDAAVHRDNQGDPLAGQGVNGVVVQAVPLFGTVWDVADHLATQRAEKLGEQTGGGDAVHVVVAVDGDGLLLPDGPGNALHGLLHIPQEKGVVEQVGAMGQKGRGRWGGVHPPGTQNGGAQGG